MAEEINDKTVAPEDMELQTGDIMMNLEPSAKEDSDIINYQNKMESDSVAEEETDKSADGANSSAIKEEVEYLRVDCDIAEGLVKNSPTDQLRKKPALVIIGSNHKFNVQSRYLSDSLGSCHDHCKYGHKHESEKKTKKLMLGTIREGQTMKTTTSDDLDKSVLERVTKKKELHRRVSLSGPIPEKAPAMHMEEKNRSKKDMNQPKMKREQSETKPTSVLSPETSSRSKTQSSNLQKSASPKVKEIKTRKEVASHSKGEKVIKAKEPMSSSPKIALKKEGKYIPGVKEIKAKEPMTNSPKTPLKKSPSMKARLYKNRKSSSNSKIQINPEEARVGGDDDIHEKTLDMIESNSNKEPKGRTSKAILSGESPRSASRTTRTGKIQGSKGNRKGSGVSLLSSSSQESSQPHGKERQGLDATKKKQTGIEKEDGGSKTSTPRAKSTVSRRLKNLDFKSTKQIDTRSNTSRAKSTVDHKLKPKRTEKNPEEKDGSAWKVKFKRGTVVALQVANNAPKKLRFKRGRTLGEDQNAKGEVDRKLKEDKMENEPHGTKTGPEKVRLRHQEASEKKDDVDLNNVIEETASKLVKTRKSKVKALVGAFETVMSLHDRKRMVETNAS